MKTFKITLTNRFNKAVKVKTVQADSKALAERKALTNYMMANCWWVTDSKEM